MSIPNTQSFERFTNCKALKISQVNPHEQNHIHPKIDFCEGVSHSGVKGQSPCLSSRQPDSPRTSPESLA